ncbi:hypothetical protein HY04AAS1_0532 [Hydrogenobaculum sp. Y04AAS1]|uniref:hypothetical protein n=1 Tax=Hydrogenobaculum sp. (strain Y04AAS1) TaxID=380749 RepID=UPI00015BD2F6|nr:hypothetical protein HY04AAS1_0532 [Hydrogenobaculum sp. Y04AAS1]HCT66384.1 hypothetical protein [Hydrogenobaculum sp.]
MMNELKEKILNWYNSLTERDKSIVIIFIAVLLPGIFVYFYFKQTAERGKIEQKISSLPSLEQLKLQSITLEKQVLYYKSQIPKLQTELLNPNINYAYATTPNQIPIVLSSAISKAGGYITSMEEGIPKDVTVDKNGKEVIALKPKMNKKKHNRVEQTKELFDIEILPVKLTVAVSQSNINNFLSSLNKPNPAYPFLFINSIKFGFGKSQCSNNIFEDKSYYIVDTTNVYSQFLDTSKPVILCMSGYVVSSITSKEHFNEKQGVKNAK